MAAACSVRMACTTSSVTPTRRGHGGGHGDRCSRSWSDPSSMNSITSSGGRISRTAFPFAATLMTPTTPEWRGAAESTVISLVSLASPCPCDALFTAMSVIPLQCNYLLQYLLQWWPSYSTRVLAILFSHDPWWLTKPEYIGSWFKVIRCKKNHTRYSPYFSLFCFRSNKVFPIIFRSRTYVTSFYHLPKQFHPK
jgi:hypothetical protein